MITDDDSSIKATMKWFNADAVINDGLDEPPFIINASGKKVVRPDKGGTPRHMAEPRFAVDLTRNHRKKSLNTCLYQLE